VNLIFITGKEIPICGTGQIYGEVFVGCSFPQ